MRVQYCDRDRLVIEWHSLVPSPIKQSNPCEPADDCNATLDSRMGNCRIWILGRDVTQVFLWEKWSNGSIIAVPAQEQKHHFNSDKGLIKINGSINFIKEQK